MATADSQPSTSDCNTTPAASNSSGKQVAIGIGALTATKGADVVTTVGGLRLDAGLRESNPIALAAMQQAGVVPGLLGMGTLTVLFIVFLTEVGVFFTNQGHGPTPDSWIVRLLGYGLGAAVNMVVVAHNTHLLATV